MTVVTALAIWGSVILDVNLVLIRRVLRHIISPKADNLNRVSVATAACASPVAGVIDRTGC